MPWDVRVRDVMRTSLHMVNGLDSVATAMAKMRELGVSSLIIERRHDNDEYGLITVRDVAAKVISYNRSTERTSIYEVMSKPALTLNAGMKVKYAARLLSRLGLGRALVSGDEGLLGLITLRDMVLSQADFQDETAGDKPEG